MNVEFDNVQDIYPLSPMQQGMLFHSLSAPAAHLYCGQRDIRFQGALNVPAFEKAWRMVFQRHPALRTAFLWEGLKEPVQVVRRDVSLEIKQEDWRERSRIEQTRSLELFLQEDRHRGFDLDKAPLMRLMLIQMADDEFQSIWTLHHILLDGWSIHHVLGDVLAYYDAFCEGREITLDTLRPYKDYIKWLKRQDPTAAERFWRQQLKGFSAPTVLSCDAIPSGEGAGQASCCEQKLQLSATLTDRLNAFAREYRLTLNTLVLGAWAVLLSRYSGQQDVVFGATVSGRPPQLSGIESMTGVFINTIPVRVHLPHEGAVAEWLPRLQKELAQLRQFEYAPLFEVQKWSDVPGGQALFDSLVIFENYSGGVGGQLHSSTLNVSESEFSPGTNYPLNLVVFPGDETVFRVIYDQSRFGHDAIEQLLGHLQTLLKGMITDRDRPLAQLSLLTEDERRVLLSDWNQTRRQFSLDSCVPELFEAEAERDSHAVAVVQEDRQLSYGELNERANRLAHYLRSLGVGGDSLVAVCMPRSVEMVVGLLGVLKAGAAYVPLDPSYPRERLAFLLQDTNAVAVLTLQHLVAGLPECDAPMLALDSEHDEIDSQSCKNPIHATTPEDLAYVIYTSGSTGYPKGVEIEHQGLINLIRWHQDEYDVSASDRATLIASPAFDASVWELWPYLTAGASVHILSEATQSPQQLVDWLNEQAITVCFLPTPLAATVIEQPWPGESPLRALLTGGDKLHSGPSQQLPFQVINHYGPTENTVVATSCPVPPATGHANAPPIGRPLPNVRVYVLDAAGNPVPIGVQGELYISGAQLARGYLNRPELTAEKFVEDPFSDRPDARMYKTGDLVRWRPDGNLEFLGRIDDQVKVRGFRIELGEIEASLARHPAVQEVVVAAREQQQGDKQLVAYLVSGNAGPPTTSQLRQFLKETLPGYMVPSAYVFLDALPLSPNGKVDRKALPAPEGNRPELEATFVAPRTEIERAIAEVWQEVLQVDKVGMNDNFFDLGGHSLLLIQAQNGLRTRLQREFSVIDLFEYPTVQALSELVSQTESPKSDFGDIQTRAGRQNAAILRQSQHAMQTKNLS